MLSQECNSLQGEMLMRKRVLLIIGSPLLNAGVPNVVMNIVRELHSEYRFDVLCLTEGQGYHDKEFRSYGGTIYHVKTLEYAQHKLLFAQRMFQIRKAVSTLLKQKTYDVIHCHCGIDAGICLKVAQKYSVRQRIAHAHGTYIRKGRNYFLRFYNWLNKQMIVLYSTKRLACSELAGQTLFPGAAFDNVLNPVDVDFYHSTMKMHHSGVQLMQIGYYCKNKNQLFSLRIVKALLQKGIDVSIRFIGYASEPQYVEKMKAYIVENGLEERVAFLPSDADKRKHLSEVDYTLLPSESEGLPLVALESQAANVPCVLSNKVPADVNMGLAHYLSIDNIEAWVDFFTSPPTTTDCLDNRIFQLTPNKYAEKIGQAYECS